MSSPHAHQPSDLSAWRIEPPCDPEFRQRVWTRIEAARARASTFRGYLRAHAFAVATSVTLAAIAGAWSGLSQGKAHAASDRAAVVAVYVRELDARAMQHP
jgi:hypothetical protein